MNSKWNEDPDIVVGHDCNIYSAKFGLFLGSMESEEEDHSRNIQKGEIHLDVGLARTLDLDLHSSLAMN